MSKTFIIAEAGVNHNGGLDMAYKLCDAAKESKADAVKFQTYVTSRCWKPDHEMYQMLKDLELSCNDFRKIKQYCDKIGIMFLSTPEDESDLDFLVNELDMPIIKVNSANLTHHEFLRAVYRKKRTTIISTGMATEQEVINALEGLWVNNGTLVFNNDSSLLYVLHCTTHYPSEYNEVNLNAMVKMNYPLYGLSDHTLGIEVPIAAVAKGATVIEKHLTLDKELPGPDHKASLDPIEFKAMVQAIRNIEKAMGDGVKRPTEYELKIKDKVRRYSD
jgi:sialic acid synthase SpsE